MSNCDNSSCFTEIAILLILWCVWNTASRLTKIEQGIAQLQRPAATQPADRERPIKAGP